MKLERAKSAGNEEDITKYTAKVKKFQDQFDALPPEKMEPYELPEGTTDDDACSVAAEMRPLLRVLVGESARRARAPATCAWPRPGLALVAGTGSCCPGAARRLEA